MFGASLIRGLSSRFTVKKLMAFVFLAAVALLGSWIVVVASLRGRDDARAVSVRRNRQVDGEMAWGDEIGGVA